MENSKTISYTISKEIPKARSSVEIPDNYTSYVKITSTSQASSPLSFVVMFGCIKEIVKDSGKVEALSKRLAKALFKENSTIISWLRSIPKRPDSWLKELFEDHTLQKELEDLLIKGCKVEEKFGARHLPAAANILYCNIMYLNPSAYQKLLVEPSNGSKHTIIISMEYANVYKLYIKKEEKSDREDYLKKKMELKEQIVKYLISEQENNYAILKNENEAIKKRLNDLREFDKLLDDLINLKTTEGKNKGKDSKMVKNLNQIKKANQEIRSRLASFEAEEIKGPKYMNRTSSKKDHGEQIEEVKKVGKCYKCDTTKQVAKLHEGCNTFFCKKHSGIIGREIRKNNSNLILIHSTMHYL